MPSLEVGSMTISIHALHEESDKYIVLVSVCGL